MMMLPSLQSVMWLFALLIVFDSTTAFLHVSNYNKCIGQQCAMIDQMLVNNVDRKQEPCYDFYKYACGLNKTDEYSNLVITARLTDTWTSYRDSRDYYSDHHRRRDQSQNYNDRIADYAARSLFNQNLDAGSRYSQVNQLLPILDDEHLLIEEEKNYYPLKIEREMLKKCKVTGYTQKEKVEFENILRRYGADRLEPNHNHEHQRNNEKWMQVDFDYAKEGFGFAFFDIDVYEDEPTVYGDNRKRPQRYIRIRPTSDNILDLNQLLMRKYVNNPKTTPTGGFTEQAYSQRAAYNGHQETGHNPNDKYMKLEKFMDELNSIVAKYKDNDESTFGDRMTVKEWKAKYESHAIDHIARINWLDTLYNFFHHKTSSKIYEDRKLMVKHQSYFFEIADLLHSTHYADTIIDYIHLRFVSKIIGFVDKEYQDLYSMIPLVKGLPCTPGLMVGAANIYTRRYFVHNNIDTLNEIYRAVKTQIINSISYDKSSMQTNQFINQLDNAKVLIGYPKWVADERIVNKFYESFRPKESYLGNQIEAIGNLLTIKLSTLDDDTIPIIDMSHFYKSFNEDRIVLEKKLKEIILPARAFGEDTCPFCSSSLDPSITYGGVGTYIASKLYTYFLTESVYFQNPSSCVADQLTREMRTKFGSSYYTRFNEDDYKLQATAYLLGAQAAYEVWPNKTSYPVEFQYFGGMTVQRLFFLSLAQSMCAAQEPLDELHPREHINFVAQNMRSFQESFYCESEYYHPMNRKHKCSPFSNRYK